MRYTKPALSIPEQIELLKSRGLIIDDHLRVEKYLRSIGYYRLSGYMYHLQLADGSHRFKTDVSFDDVIATYQFDKKLRYLISEYLERIEVATRTLLTNEFSITHGFYWYADPDRYIKPIKIGAYPDGADRMSMDIHQYICDYVKHYFSAPSELFLKKFKNTYTAEAFPPSNMAMEILTMGKLSRLYAQLKKEPETQNVALAFHLPIHVFSSWFTYLTNVRNVCAHHSRLWNRKITADRFVIPNRKALQFNGTLPDDFNTSMYGILSIMIRLLGAFNPHNNLLKKFQNLMAEYPQINISYMGFPADWEKNPAWDKPVDNEV
ncbi:Abi family protein [Pedobacter ginsengisoli]|uniref:Abi family protein n=1 Tax=Pedobacter ginsengisoli TaxID=363852 RepID=UPI00254C8C78|nr:Abi family protein [Pedobacter ginsengisoli]